MTKSVDRTSKRNKNQVKGFKSTARSSASSSPASSSDRRVDQVLIGPTSTVAASASASVSVPTSSSSSSIHDLAQKMSVVSISPKQKQFHKMNHHKGMLRKFSMHCHCGMPLRFWRESMGCFKIFDGVTTKDVPRAEDVQLICSGCESVYEFPFPREHPIRPVSSHVKRMKVVTVRKRRSVDNA